MKRIALLLLAATAVWSCKKDGTPDARCALSRNLATFSRGRSALLLVNAFSPNGDGINDVLAPIGDTSVLRSLNVTIRDASGAVVFTSESRAFRWAPADNIPAGSYRLQYEAVLAAGGNTGDSSVRGEQCIALYRSPAGKRCIPNLDTNAAFSTQYDPEFGVIALPSAEQECP